MPRYVLLDDEGQSIRYYDYEAKGTVMIAEKKLTYSELLNEVGECLL